MNHSYHDDDEDEMVLKSSMEREEEYDPNEYNYEHNEDDEAPLEEDEDDQYSDEEIPSGGQNFNFFIQGGKIPIGQTPSAPTLSEDKSSRGDRKIKEDDDFEYNIDDESDDDEIYPISSDEDEPPAALQNLKPSIQTVIRRKSPMKNTEERVTSSPQSSSRPASNSANKIRATPTKTTAPVLHDSPEENSIIPPRPKLSLGAVSKYTDDDDVRSLTSSRTTSSDNLSIGEDKMKNQLDYLKQKQEQLYKLNQQLNVETKQVLKETDDIVKQQSKKVESISSRIPSRPASSASTVRSNTPSSTHRSNVSTAATTRPSSAQPSAKKKVMERIDEVNQYEDDDLDKAANEMGTEAAMKFYKARVKSLQKDIQDYSNQMKLKDDKIKELDIKYNAAMIESKKVTKAQTQFHSRLDRQRKEFDALQLKFKKQTAMMNEMQKENEKLRQNLRMDGPGSNKEAEPATGGNNNDRIKDLKYTRALEEVEKLKSQLSEAQKQQREDNDKQRKDSENLRKDNKRLERQKQDIVLAFKKQMKLIDVLKRQIIHLEASKQLSFTEEEFTSLMNQ